ncbi:MAG: hypothetical protein PHW90_01055 [Bacilli bacterium]|nr:hypothetical protein [Bacilli bacterium]
MNTISNAPFTKKHNVNNYNDFLYCKKVTADSYVKMLVNKLASYLV